jgi:predicted esterase YcpF (UPF0227 family)
MVLYIHGFAGSGLGVKAQLVRDHFGKEATAPSLPYIPELAVDTLEQLVTQCLRHEKVHLVGSSLGGFYATHLAEKYGLKAVLVNPSTQPWKTLDLWKGFVKHYHDLSHFEWTQTHIQTLRALDPYPVKEPRNYLLMLQKDDELLDYRIALETYRGARTIVEEGGGHTYEGFEKHLDTIGEFFGL